MDTHELLKEEYFKIQEQIEKYDERALTIKAWSVTVSITGIGTAIYKHECELLLLSSLSSLLFWCIEVYWKVFQRAFYARAQAIEKYFNGSSKQLYPLQISHAWTDEFRRLRRKLSTYLMIFYPHIMLPHILVVLGGLLIYWYKK